MPSREWMAPNSADIVSKVTFRTFQWPSVWSELTNLKLVFQLIALKYPNEIASGLVIYLGRTKVGYRIDYTIEPCLGD